MVAGGAGNAANNVAALGGRGACWPAWSARDAEGRRLRREPSRGVERAHSSARGGYRTPVKTRILAGGIHSAKQQVVRIDREPAWPLSDDGEPRVRRASSPALAALRCRGAVRLRLRPGHAGARRDASARAGAPIAPPAGAGSGRLAVPAARVSGHDDVHAERVGGRAAARHADRRRSGGARAGGTRNAAAHADRRPCW